MRARVIAPPQGSCHRACSTRACECVALTAEERGARRYGVLFIKEWCDVSSNEYQIANKEHWAKYHVYHPYTVDKVIEVAESNGFKLIDSKDLSQIINPTFWQNSLKYHSQEVPLYKEIYSDKEGGYPYILPYQLKFKKI